MRAAAGTVTDGAQGPDWVDLAADQRTLLTVHATTKVLLDVKPKGLRTFALVGIDAVPVDVEVDTSPAQMPKTVLVGLPELAVRESVHRIERAGIEMVHLIADAREEEAGAERRHRGVGPRQEGAAPPPAPEERREEPA